MITRLLVISKSPVRFHYDAIDMLVTSRGMFVVCEDGSWWRVRILRDRCVAFRWPRWLSLGKLKDRATPWDCEASMRADVVSWSARMPEDEQETSE